MDILGKYIEERDEMFDLESFEDKSQDCTILSVTKNGIYAGEEYSALEISELNQRYKRVYPGDFVYNPHRINVGSIGIVPEIAEYMYVSNIYPAFFVKDPKRLPNYYLQRILKSKEYRTIINDYCLGGARADLKFEWLSRIKIGLPSRAMIDKTNELSGKLTEAYNEYIRLYKEIMQS